MQVLTTLLLLLGAAIGQENPLCGIGVCFGVNLDCLGKSLDQLPVTAEAWPSHIEEANFAQNALSHVPVLPPLQHLRKLSFRHNRISGVAAGAFAQLPQLQLLDLGFNLLASLSLSPRNLSAEALEDASGALKELRVLRLNSNALESLPGNFFAWVPELRELSLGGNPMRSLDAATVAALGSLAALEELDLSQMGLRALPENMLSRLANLRVLDISGNELTMVPPALAELRQLRALTLSSNPIRALELGSFPGSLASLHFLVMDDMRNLTRVPKHSLAALTGLRSLVLTDSPALEEIDAEAFQGLSSPLQYPPLKELVLRGNRLQTLHQNLLKTWDSLEVLDLRENKWLCDCRLKWIVASMVKHKYSRLDHIMCDQPQEIRGHDIVSEPVLLQLFPCADDRWFDPEPDTKEKINSIGIFLKGVGAGVGLSILFFCLVQIAICAKDENCTLRSSGNLSIDFNKPKKETKVPTSREEVTEAPVLNTTRSSHVIERQFTFRNGNSSDV